MGGPPLFNIWAHYWWKHCERQGFKLNPGINQGVLIQDHQFTVTNTASWETIIGESKITETRQLHYNCEVKKEETWERPPDVDNKEYMNAWSLLELNFWNIPQNLTE